jgi:hypothetical protein
MTFGLDFQFDERAHLVAWMKCVVFLQFVLQEDMRDVAAVSQVTGMQFDWFSCTCKVRLPGRKCLRLKGASILNPILHKIVDEHCLELCVETNCG